MSWNDDWSIGGGGGSVTVTSVFGRTGAVVAQNGDYITSYRKTTTKTVTNTTAATDLLNGEITIGANVLTGTEKLVATLGCDWLNNASLTVPPQFQLVIGGTTVFDTGLLTGSLENTSATRRPLRVTIECMALASSSSQVWLIRGDLGFAAVNATGSRPFVTGEGVYGWGNQSVPGFVGINTTALDMTTSKTFVFNVINAVSSANYETKLYAASVDIF